MTKRLVVVDLFCGAGGATEGLRRAAQRLRLKLDVLAINHWQTAIDTHSLNHPDVRHLCESIESVKPRQAVPGGRVHLLTAGPECTNHSRAKGGRPLDEQSRATAWHILKWAQELYIDNILIENVPDIRKWGPIGADGRPLKSKIGQTFNAFLAALRSMDYQLDVRELLAADYGDPQTRQRLFIMARRRRKIEWPMPTHSRHGTRTLFGQTLRWRSAREDVIDWSVPSRSIFGRRKPLSPKTLARIEAGLKRFGGKQLEPFLIPLTHGGGENRVHDIDQPMPTITYAHRGETALVEPFVLQQQSGGAPRSVNQPLPTIATDGAQMLIEPFLVAYHSERSGENPRVHSVGEPLPTQTTENRFGLVEPFIASYYGTQNISPVSDPLPTVTTKDRFGLVQPVINGQQLDIHLRMLKPHELAAAMSFGKAYRFTGNQGEQIKQIGNAWACRLGEALIYSLIKDYAKALPQHDLEATRIA